MFPIAWKENFSVVLPEGHRFPIDKYKRLKMQLSRSGLFSAESFFEPGALQEKKVTAVHCAHYFQRFLSGCLTEAEVRKVGFPLKKEFIERELAVTQGTLEAAERALESRVAFSIAGGTHHAFFDRGEAYCWLNDQAVAARHLIDEEEVKCVAIIDLDVHQGNGTATLLCEDQDIFTLSLHAQRCYPTKKAVSNLDVSLACGTGDEEYLVELDKALESMEKVFEPEFIFYQAGIDILAGDQLGKLNVTEEGCSRRDQRVFEFCRDRNIPICVTMGGGYCKNVEETVEAHFRTFIVAREVFF